MQKMNRKGIITSIVLMFFMMIPVCLYSVTVSTQTYTAVANFEFMEAEIHHTRVGNVFPERRYMNIKLNVAFGDYKNIDSAELLYYFGSNTSDIYKAGNSGRVLNQKDFFIKTDTWVNSSSISYQVKVTLKRQDGSVGYAYWPKQLTASSNTYCTVPIAISVSGVVPEGGSLDIEGGDQAKQDGGIDLLDELESGSGTTDVALRLLSYDELNDSPSLGGRVVGGLSIELSPEEHQKLMRVRIALENTVQKKFVMVYRENNSIPWAEGRIIKIKKVENGVVYSDIVSRMSGQYGLFESTDLDSSDYRPEKRVKIKSRIASGKYKGFEFKGLKEGDVVKIYNVSGKKIAEITDISALGVAYWNGKKGTNDSGDWAESGTYIYQIKLKEKNKIVSGTIAFVW